MLVGTDGSVIVAGKDPDVNFALHQYNLAIRDLLLASKAEAKGDLMTNTYLIGCILFACFEVCHYERASLRTQMANHLY